MQNSPFRALCNIKTSLPLCVCVCVCVGGGGGVVSVRLFWPPPSILMQWYAALLHIREKICDAKEQNVAFAVKRCCNSCWFFDSNSKEMNTRFALRFIYRSAQGIYCSLSDLYGITLSSSKDGVLFLLAEPTQIRLLVKMKLWKFNER